MPQIKKVGIVGLGLIGGSMAKSTAKHTICRVFGADKNPEAVQMAKMSGAIHEELTDENIAEMDLLMIAISPDPLIGWIKENAHKIDPHTIFVDLCGVKRAVKEVTAPLAKKYGFLYVGGHPMAGKEVQGFINADAYLYEDASMILCPDETTDIETLDTLKAFYLSLGFGEIVYSNPEEHDKIIAYTSQLAHATSSAYIKSPTSRQRMGFTAGSYRDMTRVARLDPSMWTQLFMANADNMERELEELVNNLSAYLDAVKARDPELLWNLLDKGRELKVTEPLEDC